MHPDPQREGRTAAMSGPVEQNRYPLMPSVSEMLADLAHIHRDRNSKYGDNYKHAGEVLMGLFPEGLILRTAKDFNRLHLIVHMAGKLSRYAMMMKRGGHVDSLNDLAVYAMMARECDMEEELSNAGTDQRSTAPRYTGEAGPVQGPSRGHSEEGPGRGASGLHTGRGPSTTR